MNRFFNFALLLAAPVLLAQEGSKNGEFILRSDVQLVSLDVSVRNGEGVYVGGLKATDFALYDNGKPRPVQRFSTADIPVTVGLIVDNSGSMRAKREQVVMAGLLFAKTSNSRDEFFVINFNDHVYSALPPTVEFTDKLQILRSALFFGAPVGRTALYDAIDAGLKHLEAGHRDMRVLIVVSDGGDNASKTKLTDLLHKLDGSPAVVYCIGLLDPEDHELNPHVLRKISALSGGSLFLPGSLEDVASVFEKISGDIRSRYSLGFTPGAGHGTHKVRVVAHDADGRELTVHSRTTYKVGA